MNQAATLDRTATGPTATVSAAGDTIIDVQGLSVSYGAVKAVRGISLQVRSGEIFGIVGPNGAGKTTTLSTIEGLIKPDSGTVTVMGFDVRQHTDDVQRKLGISLQTTAFFDNLKCWELVRLYASMYEVFLTKTQVVEMLSRFELAEKANALSSQLSGGQQQRMALVLAICNDPQIVILDEPTTGLDPQVRRAVWDIVRELRAEGRTVLLTTHYMEEAQELCSRIAIIDRGEVIALDTPGRLINSLKADNLISTSVHFPEDEVQAIPSVTGVRWDGGRLLITSRDPRDTVFALQKLAVEHHQVLTDLTVKQPDLEDVFIALTGRKVE